MESEWVRRAKARELPAKDFSEWIRIQEKRKREDRDVLHGYDAIREALVFGKVEGEVL